MRNMNLDLPIHPTMLHPLTGQPLRAVYVDSKGRARYPIMGGAEGDGDGGDDSGSGDAAEDQDGDSGGNDGDKSGDKGGSSDDGKKTGDKDLGFPKDTPIAEMTVAEQAAYWKHQARKHEQTWKGLVGDRKIDDIKTDLTEMERIRQEKLTPSERAIQEAEQRGREAAAAESAKTLATTILKTQLKTAGKSDQDIEDLTAAVDVTRFIKDNELDTDRLSEFVSKIAPSTDTGGGNNGRNRDFGGGRRGTSTSTGVSAGRGRYQERHGKKHTES